MTTETSTPTVPTADLDELAESVDQAIAEVQGLDESARGTAMALKTAIEAFHKVGLTHIVKKLKNDPRGKELLFELVDEPTVYALFAMHGLVRADLRTRVSRVIEMVRPYMQSHGGDVKLVDVREKVAYVQLSGACNGCSMSSQTLRNTVEESLSEHVPEIIGVEVVPDDPEPSGFVSIDSVTVGPVPAEETAPEQVSAEQASAEQITAGSIAPEHGWVQGPNVAELQDATPFAFEGEGVAILLLPTNGGLKAYRNACAHQGMPLDGGTLNAEEGTITCPWHGFRFDSASGECLTAPQCQLEPFPLRVEQNVVWVRPQ